MSKDEQRDLILDKLSKLPLYELDQKLQTKNLEMREAISQLALLQDDELVYKFNLRKKLLDEGKTFSMVGNLLKTDPKLYELSRKIIALRANKKKLGIEIEIVKSYYFATKLTGG